MGPLRRATVSAVRASPRTLQGASSTRAARWAPSDWTYTPSAPRT